MDDIIDLHSQIKAITCTVFAGKNFIPIFINKMPANLQALVRLKAIDKCLKDKSKKYALADLLETVNESLLLYKSNSDTVSERTLYGDLQFLKNDVYGFNAPIHRTNELGYHYTKDNFSIFNTEFNRSDVEQIKDVIISLRDISSKDHFDGLNQALIAMEEVLNINVPSNEQNTIFFENSLNAEGQKWITPIHKAIREKKTLNIDYQPFDKPSLNHFLCPYFLKEYNNRWFVFGYEIQAPGKEGYTGLAHYGLDRINSCNESLLNFHEEEISYDKVVEDVIGVSKRGTDVLEITFKVYGTRRHYVKTKPLHRNQKVIEYNDKFGLFGIQVIPNPEMYSRLLSFGKDLEVISPQYVKDAMKDVITDMGKLYA